MGTGCKPAPAKLLMGYSRERGFKLANINFVYWRFDSIGCIGYREIVIDTLMSQKESIIGIQRKEIYTHFGQPNYQKDNYPYFYYLFKKDARCKDADSKSHELDYETYLLQFQFDR